MEFFIPGILIFLVAVLVTYFIEPHITPFITAILSIIFLTFGVYSHYHLFASEYRLSTWQDNMKVYAPAFMIAAIILFIIYSILSLFTGVSVPIPSLPTFEVPTANTITSATMNSINNVGKSLSNATSSITNSLKNSTSAVTNSIQNISPFSNQNKSKSKNNVSRSFVETF
jgi:predicted PurR-regulated permease PerM